MRYIELNPVRAEMVTLASEYSWSSFRNNALGEPSEFILPHQEYRQLGKLAEERQAAYRQLFKHHVSEESVNAIREATNKARVLGCDRFKQRIQKQLERRVEPATRSGDRKIIGI